MKNIFPSYRIGHFINEPENPTEFELTRFEQMEEPDVEDPHKHSFYEILWIEDGHSKQTIDYNEYDLSPGSLFFISPGQVHLFEAWEHLAGGSLLFTEDFFLLNHQNKDSLFEYSFLDNFYSQPSFNPSAEGFAEIMKSIQWIEKEKQHATPSITILQSLLHVLLAQIQRCVDAQAPVVSKKYLITYKKFKQLIDENFQENYPVSHYADQLHITQHQLNLITKEVTGKTAGDVIRSRSMLEAKRMLTFTDMQVTEIAAALNFLDPSYFARLFRSETGQSPVEFKTAMSEKYRVK